MSNYSVLMNSAIHEDADIIDVSDTLQHAQHEGYYSPNNTSNKATPYIFEKLVKSSSGNQIGARFKGQGDRQWVEIFVPTVDFIPNMQNFIALFNAEKGNVKIREEEMRKAARLLTNFFNSPSLPGNEKMTTYVRKPKSLKHALFTEVYDMDDYLEHHGILGMKWGVRRYQNADGSLTDAGRKHYGVKRIKQEASSIKDPSDKQKYLMLEKQKATDKGTFHTSAAAAGGAGLAAGALTKAAIANAVASGASSVYLPVLGLAMATPVGQIASIAALTAGTAGTIYSIYREKKINQLMLDNSAEASKQPLKVDVSKKPQSSNGMYVMAKPGELPASTRVTGKEESDFWKSLANNQAFLDEAGHREAAKYGLDKGDNYKVFIDAARGDEEANRIVEEWKKMKK